MRGEPGLYNINNIWVTQFYLQQEFFKFSKQTSHIKVNNFQYIVVHLSQLPSELVVSLSVYSNDSKNISTVIIQVYNYIIIFDS